MTTQATPLAELIPDDLHMTTAERLRLVARILREHPDRHVQEVWVEDRSQSSYDWGPRASPRSLATGVSWPPTAALWPAWPAGPWPAPPLRKWTTR